MLVEAAFRTADGYGWLVREKTFVPANQAAYLAPRMPTPSATSSCRSLPQGELRSGPADVGCAFLLTRIYADRAFRPNADSRRCVAPRRRCDNEDILNHCQELNATHVRGCWVVDLVLGKD